MLVNEVMTWDAECVDADATLQQAAEKMKSLDVGALPVCENDRLIGVLTDRDITIRSVSGGHNPQADHVRDVMTPNIVFCFGDQDVAEAATYMKDHQIRRLPVLDREKRLIGIVSLGDLAIETHDEQLVGSTLEAVSEPGQPIR